MLTDIIDISTFNNVSVGCDYINSTITKENVEDLNKQYPAILNFKCVFLINLKNYNICRNIIDDKAIMNFYQALLNRFIINLNQKLDDEVVIYNARILNEIPISNENHARFYRSHEIFKGLPIGVNFSGQKHNILYYDSIVGPLEDPTSTINMDDYCLISYFCKDLSKTIQHLFNHIPNMFNGFMDIYALIGLSDYDEISFGILTGALYSTKRALSSLYYTGKSIFKMMAEFGLRQFSELEPILRDNNICIKFTDISFELDDNNIFFYSSDVPHKIPFDFISRNNFVMQFIILFEDMSQYNEFCDHCKDKAHIFIKPITDIGKFEMDMDDNALEFINDYISINYFNHEIDEDMINTMKNSAIPQSSGKYTRIGLIKGVDAAFHVQSYYDTNNFFPTNAPNFKEKDQSEDIFYEINNLIGLSDAKTKIKQIICLHEFKNKMNLKNINMNNISSMHFVFSGNPGTGKTTVAKMYANILFKSGFLKEDKILVLSRKDLIGKYVGHTERHIKDNFEKGRGGVIFIDEAYSLASDAGNNKGFGMEAINTIVDLLDIVREDTCVIFAGYPKEMDDFIDSNPGLRSRISFWIDFPDYSIDELIEISKFIAKNSFNMRISPKAISEIIRLSESKKSNKNFGNVRFIRHLIDKALINHACRCSEKMDSMSNLALQTLTFEDFQNIDLKNIREYKNKTGFGD